VTLAPTLAALLAPLLAAPVYELDFVERSEAHVRTPGDAVDFEQSAGAELALVMPRSRFNLGYTPRLQISEILTDPTFDLLHTGELGAAFTWRKVRLSLAERGAYGTRAYTSLRPVTYDVVFSDSGNRIVPIATSVRYGSSDTTLDLGFVLSARSSFDVAGGYLIDGGLDDRSKRVVPWVYGPRGRAEWRYQVARRDALGTGVEAESLHTDTASAGPTLRADVIRGRERWEHRFLPMMTGELSAGAAFAQRSPTTTDGEFFPIGAVALERRLAPGRGQRLELETRAQVDVIIDRLTGLPDHRLDLNIEGNWTRAPYGLHAGVGRTSSLRPLEENALVLYSGEVGGSYQWTPVWLVEAGFQGAYQSVESPTSSAAAAAASGFNWMFSAALEARSETLSF
jgi:hypothetical protein